MIYIGEDVAKAVFDIATNSLDFGSGFLDDEEVEHLRAYAVVIGVDPWIATPENHRPKYCPALPDHEWGEWQESAYRYPQDIEAGIRRFWRHCIHCHLDNHKIEYDN